MHSPILPLTGLALTALVASVAVSGCGSGGTSVGSATGASSQPVVANSQSAEASQPADANNGQPVGGGAAQAVAVTVTPAGCSAAPESVPAGPVNFTVKNVGAPKVTEIELAKAGDNDILASREDLKPGLTRTFSFPLAAGSYTLGCEGATKEAVPFTVTGSAAASMLSPAQQAVAASYKTYALTRADRLIATTKLFTNALRGGNIQAAMAAYGPAHMIYEDIEFVGDHLDDGKLDQAIDARQTAADEEGGQENWTGFHRLEKMLFADHTLAGARPLANRLDTDVVALRRVVAAHSFQPAELANGAAASIDESLQVHLPALEDHYSHTGLWDVAGKLASAKELFSVLKPTVAQADPGVADQVQTALDRMTSQMDKLKKGGRYVDYSTVTPADRKALTTYATQLDDALSKVPALVV